MLTSIKNPKVAAAVRLKKRAFREQDRRFLVEGAQGVGEALEHPGDLVSLFVSDDADPLAVRARQTGVEVHEVSPDLMAIAKGLGLLADELREIEDADPQGHKHPRFKKSDDATAVLLKLI